MGKKEDFTYEQKREIEHISKDNISTSIGLFIVFAVVSSIMFWIFFYVVFTTEDYCDPIKTNDCIKWTWLSPKTDKQEKEFDWNCKKEEYFTCINHRTQEQIGTYREDIALDFKNKNPISVECNSKMLNTYRHTVI